MNDKNYIKISRATRYHPLFCEARRFSKFEAWLYILLNAYPEEKTEAHYGAETIVPAGAFPTTLSKLSTDWNWSKKAVSNFLNYLSDENIIETKATKEGNSLGAGLGTTISVIDWELYEGRVTSKRNSKGTSKKTTKSNNEYDIILSHWNKQKITIHKKLSPETIKEIDAKLKNYSLQEILETISRYAEINHDKNYFFNYNWTLLNFLKQKNAFPDFLEEGQKWLAYQKNKNRNQEESPNLDVYDYKRGW